MYEPLLPALSRHPLIFFSFLFLSDAVVWLLVDAVPVVSCEPELDEPVVLWPVWLEVELLGELFGSCPVLLPELVLLVPDCDPLLLLGVVEDVCARAKTAHSSRNRVVTISFFMNHIPPGPVFL